MSEHTHLIIDADKHFIIDPDSRSITNQTPTKKSLMQYDHNSERFTFQVPRMVENHDMSKTDRVEIHYVNTGTGTSVSQRATHADIYEVEDVQVYSEDENAVIGSWLISDNATQYAGTLKFLVKFICTDDEGNITYTWHSNLFSDITIMQGLNNTDTVIERNPDVITQIYKEIDKLSDMPELVEALLKERVEPLEARMDTAEEKIQKLRDDFDYVPIAINSFTNTVNTVEIGRKITDVTFNWTLNKDAKKVTFNGIDQSINKTGNVTLSGLSVTTNTSWKLEVIDNRDLKKEANTSVTFLNGIYYGVASIPAKYDSAFILGLGKPNLRNSKLTSINVNAGEGQYIYYCLPKRFGTCTFTVGGFTGGFTLVDTIEFTNASGYKENYYIYKSDNAGLGSTSVTIA